MATRPTNTIGKELNAAQLAISNSLAESEIQSLVAAYGYTAARLEEGRSLYEAALKGVDAQQAAAGAQRQATEQTMASYSGAVDAYQALAKVARAVFIRQPARLSALELNARMPLRIADFLKRAYTLFDNASTLPELKGALGAYGYDQARLESERGRIVALDQANHAQEAAKGAAQQATQDQEAALKALHEWRAKYIKVARVALRGKRQLLEKLEVPARTTLTAAQAAARRARRPGGSQPAEQPPSPTPPSQS